MRHCSRLDMEDDGSFLPMLERKLELELERFPSDVCILPNSEKRKGP